MSRPSSHYPNMPQSGHDAAFDRYGIGISSQRAVNSPVRSCLVFGVQADGTEVSTVEGLAGSDELSDLQQAFSDHHGLQCGFCTPGFLMTLEPFVQDADPAALDDRTIREALAGNLCRCTGYEKILDAVRLAAARKAAP